MAEKKPICLYNGQMKEIQSGDTIHGASGGSGVSDQNIQSEINILLGRNDIKCIINNYTSSVLTSIDYYNSDGGNKLYTVALTYDASNNVTQRLITRISDGAKEQWDYTYTSGLVTKLVISTPVTPTSEQDQTIIKVFTIGYFPPVDDDEFELQMLFG